MYDIREFRLINFVIAMFSFLVVILVSIPIYADINSIPAIGITTTVFVVLSFIINGAIRNALDKFIQKEIERYRGRHVREFFNYLEDNTEFVKNVLKEDIPRYDEDRKKIGVQTINHALGDMKWKYLNTKC
jgi:hypothetical protein